MPGDFAAALESDEVLVSNEFVLTARAFRRISGILYADTGISLASSKAFLVYSRLAKRLRDLNLPDFLTYCDLVANDGNQAERMRMCAALTTNVTRFFREPHHFKHFEAVAAPELLSNTARGRRLRIWSCACSSGQEPYSIALSLFRLDHDIGSKDVKILATDFNADMLAEGRKATYSAEEIAPVPSELRSKWMRRTSAGQYEIAPRLKAMVRFRELNLNGPWPMRGSFQVIFCRNVVIYFDEPTRDRLWCRLAQVLDEGGYLYIGHSERIGGAAVRYFDGADATIYRRNDRRVT